MRLILGIAEARPPIARLPTLPPLRLLSLTWLSRHRPFSLLTLILRSLRSRLLLRRLLLLLLLLLPGELQRRGVRIRIRIHRAKPAYLRRRVIRRRNAATGLVAEPAVHRRSVVRHARCVPSQVPLLSHDRLPHPGKDATRVSDVAWFPNTVTAV